MLSPLTHANRRRALSQLLDDAPVLLIGNGPSARNIPLARQPFRQDSSVLYFSGCVRPSAAMLIEAGGVSTLFLVPPDDDDPLWHGYTWTLDQVRQELGFDRVLPLDELEARCAPHRGHLLGLAVSDPLATARASALIGQPLRFGDPSQAGSSALIEAIIRLRRTLAPEEVEQIRLAAAVTARAHRTAMSITRPGVPEQHIAALFDSVVQAAGMQTAYKSIVTVRGEVLHNEDYPNLCGADDLLLLDGGAEARSGYASDVTRTWPVRGSFDPRQRAAYQAVLDAQVQAIAMVRPGVRYRDIHDRASLVLADWLVHEGLLRGAPSDLVERGAHALFFPHGVGHLLGLDVHDMEAFGDRVAYAPGRSRSPLFGTRFLRLDLDLQPGMCVTIEPGFYLVPAIFSDRELMERFADVLDVERALSWKGVNIRIEDDVLCTEDEPQVLTAAIPKDPGELCACLGTAPDPFAQ